MDLSAEIKVENGNIEIIGKEFTLLQGSQYYQTNNSSVIAFYQKSQIFDFVIYPHWMIKRKDIIKGIYPLYGETVLNYSAQQFKQEVHFKCVIKIFVTLFEQLLPLICFQNFFYKRQFGFKVLLKTTVKTNEQYLFNCNEFIKKIFPKKQIIFKNMNKMQEYLNEKDLSPNISLEKVTELFKNLSKNKIHKIFISQSDMLWIKQAIGYKGSKYSKIYDGLENNFNPIQLHKHLNKKCKILYLLQTKKEQVIAFYPNFLHQINFSSPFGKYYGDPAKKSMILNPKKKQIYRLKDAKCAVGYGPQLLLAIGKIDIVLTAYNMSNRCYFPFSYQGCQFLLQKQFELKQLQGFTII